MAALAGCGQKEPTLDEFMVEFNAAMYKYDNLVLDSVPARTGGRAQYRQALADNLRSHAAQLEPIIAELQDMKAPSDPPEADALRRLMLETVKLGQDHLTQMASAIENDEPFTDSAILAGRLVENMERLADLVDAVGFDSSKYRKNIEIMERSSLQGDERL